VGLLLNELDGGTDHFSPEGIAKTAGEMTGHGFSDPEDHHEYVSVTFSVDLHMNVRLRCLCVSLSLSGA
jgi:hypothetical protein